MRRVSVDLACLLVARRALGWGGASPNVDRLPSRRRLAGRLRPRSGRRHPFLRRHGGDRTTVWPGGVVRNEAARNRQEAA